MRRVVTLGGHSNGRGHQVRGLSGRLVRNPHEARLNVIIIDIAVFGSAAYDYGWHELTLKWKNGESHYTRTRYMEVWNKRANGERPITKYIDNPDRPDTID